MLRLALIHGCQHAAVQYAAAVRRVRGLSITALVQPDMATRQATAEALGISATAGSLEELLAWHCREFDAVLVRGSVTKRTAIACQAAQAQKHVFLTSPAATTDGEVSRMESACRSAGVTMMVGSRRRFEPSIAAVKSALDSGKLGKPALLRQHHWLPAESDGTEVGAIAARPHSGRIWAEFVNQLDLAIWLFGCPPTEIFVQGRGSVPEQAEWPDYLQMHLGFSAGGMALMTLADCLPVGARYDGLTLIGSTGAAYADDHHQKQLKFLGGAPQTAQSNDDIPAKVAQLSAFRQAVTDPQLGPASVRDMITALQLTEAAWTSLRRKQPVSFAEGQHVVPT